MEAINPHNISQEVAQREVNENIYGDDMPQDQSGLIRWQEDLSPILERLKHNLRSEFFNDGSNKYEKIQVPVGQNEDGTVIYGEMPPILDDYNIHVLLSNLDLTLNQNTMLGNHKGDKASRILINNADSITDFFSELMRTGALSVENADMLWSHIVSVVYNTYNRGEQNLERIYNKSVNKNIFTHSMDGNNSNKGVQSNGS